MKVERQIKNTEVLADPFYRRLKEHVIDATGLSHYQDRDADLVVRVCEGMERVKANSCADYLSVLQGGVGDLSGEWDLLVQSLTIGETHFMRHLEQFQTIEKTILPEIIEKKSASERSLRIWSAACSTGEEAYTLAIILERLSMSYPELKIFLVGTDINKRYLTMAQKGQYTKWSFRGTDDHFVAKYFSNVGDRWQIKSQYQKNVCFLFHNLATSPCPSLPHNLFAFDLILCRNVFIYFDEQRRRLITEKLKAALCDGGFLIAGPADQLVEENKELVLRSDLAFSIYQKQTEAKPANESRQSTPTIAPIARTKPREQVTPEVLLNKLLPQEPKEHGLAELQNLPSKNDQMAIDQILKNIAQGLWEQSLEPSTLYLEANRQDPFAYFVYGIIIEHFGWTQAGIQAFNRALYLDNKFVAAHYHLGLFYQKLGLFKDAKRCLVNTKRIVESLTSDMKPPLLGDVTVEKLALDIEGQLEFLRGFDDSN